MAAAGRETGSYAVVSLVVNDALGRKDTAYDLATKQLSREYRMRRIRMSFDMLSTQIPPSYK